MSAQRTSRVAPQRPAASVRGNSTELAGAVLIGSLLGAHCLVIVVNSLAWAPSKTARVAGPLGELVDGAAGVGMIPTEDRLSTERRVANNSQALVARWTPIAGGVGRAHAEALDLAAVLDLQLEVKHEFSPHGTGLNFGGLRARVRLRAYWGRSMLLGESQRTNSQR